MGWCAEFGVQIGKGCGELMVASSDRCRCDTCGTECTGKFSGCPEVWARGPRTARATRGLGLNTRRRTIEMPLRVEDHPDDGAAAGGALPSGEQANGANVQAQLEGITTLIAGQQEAVTRLERDQAALLEQQDKIGKLARDQALLLDAVASLRDETGRVIAMGELADAALDIARQIERTSGRLDRRLNELGQLVVDLSARIDRVTPSDGGPAPSEDSRDG